MVCKTIKDWAAKCLKRDDNRCQLARKSCTGIAVDVHHIIPRRYRQVKYDTDNGISLCRKCHIWAERNPKEFREWLGKDKYDNLWKKARAKSQQFRKEQE